MNKTYNPTVGRIIACIIPTILTIINNRPECYASFCLILCYLLIYWYKIRIYKYIGNICGFFVVFLSVVRYYIVPLLIIIDNEYMDYQPHGLGANSNYFTAGILMTIWEMIVFAVFIAKKFPKWYHVYSVPDVIFNNKQANAKTWFLAILFFAGMFSVNPGVINDFSFVLNLQTDDTIMDEYIQKSLIDTVAIIGARALKIIIPIPFLCYFYKKCIRGANFMNYAFALMITLFFYGFLIEGNSRNSVIIPAVAAMFILINCFPRYKRNTIFLFVGSILIISILSLIWKSFSNDVVEMNNNTLSYWISYIEVYFAGISNIGKAVYAYQQSTIYLDPMIAFNDLFRNVVFFNKLIDYSNTSSFYFVQAWGRTDQVIPASGNGLFYFGYLFAPCVPILIFSIARYFESKAYSSKSLPDYIIYSYACVVICYNTFNSVSTMMMKLSITLLPLLLASYLCRNNSK